MLTSIEKKDYVFLVEDYNYLSPFSHLGSNTFLEPYFSINSLAIDDCSFGKSYGISNNIEKFSTAYFYKTIKIFNYIPTKKKSHFRRYQMTFLAQCVDILTTYGPNTT